MSRQQCENRETDVYLSSNGLQVNIMPLTVTSTTTTILLFAFHPFVVYK